MKRNFKSKVIAGLLVGVLAVGSVSAVALETGNAYENYKSAVQQTLAATNKTVTTDITVKQDGDVILSGSAILQMDGENQYSNSKLEINGETLEVESATAEGTTITRVGEQYTFQSQEGRENGLNIAEWFSSILQEGSENDLNLDELFGSLFQEGSENDLNLEEYFSSMFQEGGENGLNIAGRFGFKSQGGRKNDWNVGEGYSASSSSAKLMETVIDLLIGDVKTCFTESGNTITMNLEGEQIPELFNLALSVALEQSVNETNKIETNKTDSEDALFGGVGFAITQEIAITRISLEGELKDGYLADAVITIVLSGKDSDGTVHEIELVCNVHVSDIGSTTPDTIDMTGQTATEAARSNSRR